MNNQHHVTDPTLNDPDARAYTDIVGAHIYGIQPQAYPLAKTHGLEYWMTERSHLDPPYDPSIAGMGLVTANWIHDCLARAEYNAFFYWWLAADNNNEGITSVNLGTPKRYWVMGNYSRFIRPGYYLSLIHI